nr:hypothetical protein [Tanacetum cinerariifolium]
MGRDIVQLETAVNTISQEYLLEFTSEYGIPEALYPELPRPEDRIIDFPEGKVDERVFPTVVDWRTSAPKDWMPAENTYSSKAVRILDTHRTPIQSQPEALVFLVGLSHRYYLGDEVYPTFLHDDEREVEDPTEATDSSGVHSTTERSPLDFANEAGLEDQGAMALEVLLPEDVPTTRGAPEAGQAKSVAATAPPVVKESRKRGNDGVAANAPPKVLRRDHADPRPTGSTRGGKSLAAIELGMGSTHPTPVPPSAPADVSDPDPLSFVDPQSRPSADVAQSSQGTVAAGDSESENTSFASMVGSPESIYRPEWGIANSSMLDTPEACQDLVDYVAPPAKLLKKYVARMARRDKRIQAREHKIKNLEALLEAEADMKKATEDKSAKLSQELEDIRALFSDLQVSNDYLSQQVATLQEQVSEEEKLKAAFEEFKQYEDSRVEQRCAEMDARLDDRTRAALGLDQLEGLKDAPMDVIMAALYLESDTGDDALHWVRELRPSSSQLTIHVYQEVRDPLNPWACKEEMLLADAIMANVSRAEKKKKCRVVCRTHGVGSAHHARSDDVPVSVPTVTPQGLAILLADTATQTESDEASQLPRSSSLPVMRS